MKCLWIFYFFHVLVSCTWLLQTSKSWTIPPLLEFICWLSYDTISVCCVNILSKLIQYIISKLKKIIFSEPLIDFESISTNEIFLWFLSEELLATICQFSHCADIQEQIFRWICFSYDWWLMNFKGFAKEFSLKKRFHFQKLTLRLHD